LTYLKVLDPGFDADCLLMDGAIVRTEFLGRTRSGERFTIEVSIGAPFAVRGGRVWTCPVSVRPLMPQLRSIDGADAFQALCLACAAVVQALAQYRASGGAVLHSNGSACPLDAYLPGGGGPA